MAVGSGRRTFFSRTCVFFEKNIESNPNDYETSIWFYDKLVFLTVGNVSMPGSGCFCWTSHTPVPRQSRNPPQRPRAQFAPGLFPAGNGKVLTVFGWFCSKMGGHRKSMSQHSRKKIVWISLVHMVVWRFETFYIQYGHILCVSVWCQTHGWCQKH